MPQHLCPSILVMELTKREKEILDLIMDEMSSKEIAERLQVSISTVEAYRRSLFRKFGVRSVIGLVKGGHENVAHRNYNSVWYGRYPPHGSELGGRDENLTTAFC
jgi:DNA-binding CsgD family transcriptional regulator